MQIALEQPLFCRDPQVLCAAARTCKDWRQAVQQCGLCSTDAVLDLDSWRPVQKLPSFAIWLLKHAQLLQSITANASPSMFLYGTVGYDDAVAVAQPVQHALEAAAAGRTAAASTNTLPAAAAAAATAHKLAASTHAAALLPSSDRPQQQQQQQGLQLASFSTNCLAVPGLLAALPAHSLTRLHLNLQLVALQARALPLADMDGSAVSAALVQLSSLRQLHISNSLNCLPGSCLAGIAQLRQLTLLKLQGSWEWDVEEQLLQPLAQPLPLQQLHIDLEHYPLRNNLWEMQLAHLTQLQQLHSSIVLSQDSVLPEQLQDLTLMHRFQGLETVPTTVLDLKQLQRLELSVGFEEPRLLLQLAALPALQYMKLMYSQAEDAVATASAWAQLPQLRELSLRLLDINVSVEELQSIAAGAAAAAGLTKLVLSVCMQPAGGILPLARVDDAAEASDNDGGGTTTPGAAICCGLAGLASLQDLEISGPMLTPCDALALTALTRLTHLALGALRDGADIDRTVDVALARSLKQLRCLALPSGCRAGRAEIEAAASELTQLTELHFDPGSDLDQDLHGS
jgi:hypothetical protein